MLNLSRRLRQRAPALVLAVACTAALSGCTTLGSIMSPYSEKFACKNNDHGQCIHPDRAYADAVAGRSSRSDPSVTRDKTMLQDPRTDRTVARAVRRMKGQAAPYLGYRDSVYRELQGLVEAPVTPMLRPGRTVRTLILPYADRERPERLYMPRYVYSVLDSPIWVVGDYLVSPVSPTSRAPILEQVREKPLDQTLPSDQPVTPEIATDAQPEARR